MDRLTMMPTPISRIFLDTGGFIALSDESDQYHREAAAFWNAIPGVRRYTTAAVVSESYTHLRCRLGLEAALTFAEKLFESEATP